MSNGINVRMQRRSMVVLFILVFLGFPILALRLVNLQMIQGAHLQKMASDQQLTDTKLNSKRGTIYDRNMNPLAQSASVWTVVMEPSYIDSEEKREKICSGLHEILEIDKDKLLELSRKRSFYTIVKKKVESDVKDKIIDFKTKNKITSGIRLIEDYKRYYPLKNFAASVLGFTGADSQGLAGIEAYYDKVLRGEPGRILTARNAVGKEMPFEYEQLVDPIAGHNLKLTLDENIQKLMEKALEEGIKTHNVKNRATAIAMDVNTGEILGMAVKGDFDPNEPFKIADPEKEAYVNSLPEEEKQKAINEALSYQWRNKAVSDTYYPGSVFKMIVCAMVLSLRIVDDNWRYTCTGAIKPYEGAKPIKCHKHSGHGTQSLTQALCHSCNPAFITLGQRVGAENFFKFYKSFGFHNKTGIDLPGESSDYFFKLNDEGNMHQIDLCTGSIGQNFGITPIQMITAASAIANGGKIVQPHIVKEILDENGNVVKKFEPEVKRRVISEQTAEKVRSMLHENAVHGAAKNAYIAGYRVAGKTGTSEKIGLSAPGQKDYIASFCGFAPAEKPQIAMLVFFDTPKGGSYYGAAVAAPAFAMAMKDILPYMGIEKAYSEEELKKIDTVVPNLVDKNVAAAKNVVASLGLNAMVTGSGDKVLSQIPEASGHIPKGGTVILHTDNETNSKVKVPKFIGLPISEVNSVASNAGLNVKLTGSELSDPNIKVASQSIEEGQEVAAGTVIELNFVHTDDVSD